MTRRSTDVPVLCTSRGPLARGDQMYALRKIVKVLRQTPQPVLHAQVVLTVEANPAQDRPARVEVGAVVAGHTIRAHAMADDLHKAADLVVDRLRRRLDAVRARRRSRLRRHGTEILQWRHGGLPSRPVNEPRPNGAGSHPVVKRKTFVLAPMTPGEAADQMELLDHDFYLFADRDTGADAVVYRRCNGDYGVLGPIGSAGPDGSGVRPPVLTPEQARERLDLTADRFVFYRAASDERARVLYRRYDGCCGLLVAA
ncbi:ribosomal subunit interface protein [Kribbella orskensis]|uniref:Ribosomal subunit interface protein n=1 Tax=Kribbella orskensis TaxID=2512216 RepID=A0ABY2B7W8_9ACTN|nr:MULTISPECIES: HPF/RaiA family ribosome-associated protein [Kribbella]TCN27644.1 ribosomal subunit interface protein [Kribbella sp. VKM Ac-2500]TCO07566.1 ribosomal subunit interface protein [Kribbella orskensis]